MLLAGNRKNEREKGRITGQANQGWVHALAGAQAVNAVVHPVLGNIAVDQGVAINTRKLEDKEQAQCQRRECDAKEEPRIAPQKLQELFHQGSASVMGVCEGCPTRRGGSSTVWRRLDLSLQIRCRACFVLVQELPLANSSPGRGA